jgi:hypothetical protein
MDKRVFGFMVRVIMAVILVISVGVADAITASPAGAATAASSLAPCTTPLFG